MGFSHSCPGLLLDVGASSLFQYPQSGSRPCRKKVTSYTNGSSAFQYPQSGSRPCRTAGCNGDVVRCCIFQYPQSGSRPCRSIEGPRQASILPSFSTLKAG